MRDLNGSGCHKDYNLFSCDGNWERTTIAAKDDMVLSKAVELCGLAIYGGTGRLDGWDLLQSSSVDAAVLKHRASELLIQIQSTLPLVEYEKPERVELEDIGPNQSQNVTTVSAPVSYVASPNHRALPSHVHVSVSEPQLSQGDNPNVASQKPLYIQTGGDLGSSEHLESGGTEVSEQILKAQKKTSSMFDHILLPLHLTFYLTHDSRSKDVTAR